MKKYMQLMLKALSLASGFALISGSMAVAADAAADSAKLSETAVVTQVADQVKEVATPAADTQEEKLIKRRHHKHGKKHHKWSEEDRAKFLNERIDKHMMHRRQHENSFHNQFAKAKAADVASVAPKTLVEIGMMIDDSARRFELFKYIEASEGKTVSAEDRAAFKKLLEAEVVSMRNEAREVRELIGNMAIDNNFALMDEAAVLKMYRSTFEHDHHGDHRHHNHNRAPQRKHAEDSRDTDGDGVVSKKEKRAAARRAKAKKAKTKKARAKAKRAKKQRNLPE